MLRFAYGNGKEIVSAISSSGCHAALQVFGRSGQITQTLFGKDFERLFKRIVNIAPPPIGLGAES